MQEAGQGLGSRAPGGCSSHGETGREPPFAPVAKDSRLWSSLALGDRGSVEPPPGWCVDGEGPGGGGLVLHLVGEGEGGRAGAQSLSLITAWAGGRGEYGGRGTDPLGTGMAVPSPALGLDGAGGEGALAQGFFELGFPPPLHAPRSVPRA